MYELFKDGWGGGRQAGLVCTLVFHENKVWVVVVGASILLTLWRNILRQNALVIGLDAHSTNRLLHSNFKLLRVYCELRLTFLYLQMYLRVHLPCIYVSKNIDIYVLLERIRAMLNYFQGWVHGKEWFPNFFCISVFVTIAGNSFICQDSNRRACIAESSIRICLILRDTLHITS